MSSMTFRFTSGASMSRFLTALAGFAIFLLVDASAVAAQDTVENPPLRVFLECSACDFDLVREEIGYIDWMRDRADADLHVISRVQATGGGGREFMLDFTGLRRHAGLADTLVYYADRDDSTDTTRRGLIRLLTMGLMRYLADTPVANQLQVRILPATASTALVRSTAAVRDPWNAWTFTVSGSGSASGESSRSSRSFSSGLTANRTTADWKLNFRGSGNFSRQSVSYTIAGRDTTSVTSTESTSGSSLIARSISGHTSVGLRANLGTSSVNNTRFYVNVAPAIEYNFFPYSESTRRALLVQYSIGMIANKYREETIYFRMDETRPTHSLDASYDTRARWGSASVSLSGSQYLHDTALNNLGMSAYTSVSLLRGFSLSFSGSYSRVRDQITLARRQLTPEEVLLRQRSLATGFRYSSSVSLSYRFGSAVQNVVNNRFAL